MLKPFIFENSSYEAISSDSSSLYVLILLFIGIALLVQVIFRRNQKFQKYLAQGMRIAIPYYLSIILLKYGTDKVSMSQFYRPEANILYTPLGYLDKDILFWSTLGISPVYNGFLGFSQIMTGVLLLFKRTRLFGYVLSLFIVANIVAINMSFDISVKLFSLFLLFTTIIGLLHYASIFKRISQEIKANHQKKNAFPKHSFLYPFLKSLGLLFILFELVYPSIQKKTGLNTGRGYKSLVGAYEVTETKENNLLIKNPEVKRIFIHSNGYLIFQDSNDQMTDYKLQVFKEKHQMVISDYHSKKTAINYLKEKDIFIIEFVEEAKKYRLTTKILDHTTLPLLKDAFHWTIDELE